MIYSNVKAGLRKLFMAEILTIVSGLSIGLNGNNLDIISFVLGLVGVVAFIVSLFGLKQCSLDDVAYKKPFYFTIAALFVCLIVVIIGVVQNDSAIGESAEEIQGVFNFLIAYSIMKITAGILRKREKDAEAEYAEKARKLYTIAFIISEALLIVSDTSDSNVMIALTLILSIAALVLLVIAQIKYIIFLKKSSDAL